MNQNGTLPQPPRAGYASGPDQRPRQAVVGAGFQADCGRYIQEEVEPLAPGQLVAYQFGSPLRLDQPGLTYTRVVTSACPLP